MISRLVDYARARFERETRTYTYLDTYRQGRCWIETRTFDLFNMASSSEHFHCPFDGCSRHYTRYHDLKRHWVKLHNQSLEQLTELQPRNQKPFVCTECGHTFTRNDSLKVHQSKFHGSRETKEGRFKCPYVEECDQKTSSILECAWFDQTLPRSAQ